MKITLDHKALERLIGGDSEIEIDLRQGVAETFAKKYIKEVANSEIMKQSVIVIREAVAEEIKNQLGTYIKDWNKEEIKLTPRFEILIKEKIKDLVDYQINAAIDSLNIYKQVEEALNKIPAQVESVIDRNIIKRVNIEVENRLKAISEALKEKV